MLPGGKKVVLTARVHKPLFGPAEGELILLEMPQVLPLCCAVGTDTLCCVRPWIFPINCAPPQSNAQDNLATIVGYASWESIGSLMHNQAASSPMGDLDVFGVVAWSRATRVGLI